VSDNHVGTLQGVLAGAQRVDAYREPVDAYSAPAMPSRAVTSTPTAPGSASGAPEPVPAPVRAPQATVGEGERRQAPGNGTAVSRSVGGPARWGRRGKVVRWSGGLVKLAASGAEGADRLAQAEQVMTIRRATWTRAVNVVTVNKKGGSGKTPYALILAGILGSIRGGYVAVVEGGEADGTLWSRAEGSPPGGLAELLAGRETIHSAGNLASFTAPQTSYSDVIGSAGRRRNLTAADVLHARTVLDTYYRITVTDTGNNPGHQAFQAALRTADAVVVPCLVSLDATDGAVAAVHDVIDSDPDPGGLRSRIVIILGHDGGPEDPEVAAWVHATLGDLGARAVIEVPYDPVIRAGSEISIGALTEASQRAWTTAAAEVVRALQAASTDVDLVERLLIAMNRQSRQEGHTR
jgi:hypothetical protein